MTRAHQTRAHTVRFLLWVALTLPPLCRLQGMLTPPAGRLRHPERFPPASAAIQTTSPGGPVPLVDWLTAGSHPLHPPSTLHCNCSRLRPLHPHHHHHHPLGLLCSGGSCLFVCLVESLKLRKFARKKSPAPFFFPEVDFDWCHAVVLLRSFRITYWASQTVDFVRSKIRLQLCHFPFKWTDWSSCTEFFFFFSLIHRPSTFFKCTLGYNIFKKML